MGNPLPKVDEDAGWYWNLPDIPRGPAQEPEPRVPAEFTDVPAAIDATASAATANVGVSLLRRVVMTIDFPGDAIWLQARDTDAGAELEQQR